MSTFDSEVIEEIGADITATQGAKNSEDSSSSTGSQSLKRTLVEIELGGAPDPFTIHRSLHPEERQFGYEDRTRLRFD